MIVPASVERLACHRGGCGAPVLVQWRRRPTAGELAERVRAEEKLRAEIVALADPQAPPAFGDLPSVENTVVSVHSCADHAIHIEAAVFVHASDCTGCTCTPEPHPAAPEPPATVTLPTGWTVPAT